MHEEYLTAEKTMFYENSRIFALYGQRIFKQI